MERIEGADIHFGLDIAATKAALGKTSTELLMQWARCSIEGLKITLDTPNYEVLLQAPEAFEVTDGTERQIYFRYIFGECLSNSHSEAKEVE